MRAIWFHANPTLSDYRYPCHHRYLYLGVLPLQQHPWVSPIRYHRQDYILGSQISQDHTLAIMKFRNRQSPIDNQLSHIGNHFTNTWKGLVSTTACSCTFCMKNIKKLWWKFGKWGKGWWMEKELDVGEELDERMGDAGIWMKMWNCKCAACSISLREMGRH